MIIRTSEVIERKGIIVRVSVEKRCPINTAITERLEIGRETENRLRRILLLITKELTEPTT